MAIKVNGTTVINDSRALQNVASVDATTVAALGAAGVGGGKNNVLTVIQDTSGTFTVPFDCTMAIQLIGGGGTGARMASPYGSNRTALVTGGASGGTAIKKVSVTAGQTFTVTIGGGAITPWAGVFSSWENGLAGGTSTITGTNVNMTANGGGGGTYYNSSGYDPTKTLTSAAGGSASGGDTNLTGNTSTAKIGFDQSYYTLAVGCSSGASAGRVGAVTEVNTKHKTNMGLAGATYDDANLQGAVSEQSDGPFYYYQAATSRGSSALFALATAAGSYREVQRRADGGTLSPDGWLGKYGGGCGANMISAYASNISTEIINGESNVKAGDGACLFTMFLDL